MSSPREENENAVQVSTSVATPLRDVSGIIPPNHIAHPESVLQMNHHGGHLSLLVYGSRYEVTLGKTVTEEGVVAETGEPWMKEATGESLQGTVEMRTEYVMLRQGVFRVRLALAANYPWEQPFPPDPDFPPQFLRPFLFPGDSGAEPLGGIKREDMVCGLSLRSGSGDTWVNPRGSGLEISHSCNPFEVVARWQAPVPPESPGRTEDQDDDDDDDDDAPDAGSPPDGIDWSRREGLFYQQAPVGPFTPSLIPSGILALSDGSLVGNELLVLQKGEILQTGGAGRHRTSTKRFGEYGEAHRSLMAEPVPPEVRENIKQHFGGTYIDNPMEMTPAPFFYTNRGWGVLMKDPLLIQMASLTDGRALIALLMSAGVTGMFDYIVVRGEALQACLEEYAIDPLPGQPSS